MRQTILASLFVFGAFVVGCSQHPTPSPSAIASVTATPTATPAATPTGSPSRILEIDEAGTQFSVPENFSNFAKMKDSWLGSTSPDKKCLVFVQAKEWTEWEDVVKSCEALFTDFKASSRDITKDTSNGIEVWYDFGTATILKKRYAVMLAAYQLKEHDFDIVVAWDPNDKSMKDVAVKILKSVTRKEESEED